MYRAVALLGAAWNKRNTERDDVSSRKSWEKSNLFGLQEKRGQPADVIIIFVEDNNTGLPVCM